MKSNCNLLMNIKQTLAPPRNTKHMAIDGHASLLSQTAFPIPVKLPRCTIGFVGPVNGINKDVTDAKLLPTTVSTYVVD